MVYTVLAHRSRNDAGSIRNGQIASGIHRNSQVRQNQIAYHFRVCRSSSDGQAGIRRRTVFTLRTLRAGFAGVALLSLRAGFAGVALLSFFTLRTLRADFTSVSLLAFLSGIAFFTLAGARCNALQNLILEFHLICECLACFIAHRVIDELPCVIHFLSPL